ncbi:MAG: mechanosensitive ion channel, partial [Bdellovibrionales bacterium]|nr:mechanosensitive ion channel [Bdellovibrionales bacterium]
IRVGDLIEVGQLMGTVKHIGLRSTHVRTGNNIDIIVPNNAFLEKDVVNWTLTNPKVRLKVSVGVAYGSPTERVRELLLQAAKECDSVLSFPPPFVLFVDFGSDALAFELHFWAKVKTVMDREGVQSDLRFTIDRRFREAGVVIAFPQRDVHLDAAAPLSVRLVNDEQ